MANRDVKLTIRAKDDASAVIKKVTEALAKYGTGQDDVSRKLAPISDKFRRMTDEVTGLQKAMGRAKGQVALTEQFNILNAALAKAADQHRQSTEALVTHSAALKTNKESLETVMTARTKVREALSEEKKDLNSATAAIERHTAGMGTSSLISPATMIGTEQIMVTKMVKAILSGSVIAASNLDIVSLFRKLG